MLKNALLLTSAAAIGQFAQIVAVALLATLYSPAAFGDLSIAVSMSAFAAVVIGLQLPFAIPFAGSKANRLNILKVIRVNILSSSTISVILIFMYPSGYTFSLIIGAAVCLANIMKSYSVYVGNSREIAHYYLYRAAIIICMQVLFFKFGPLGLVWGLAIGELIATSLLAFRVAPFFFWLRRPDLSRYAATVKNFHSFTASGVLQESVSICVVLIPFVYADLRYSAAELGNFGMVYRLTWGPAAMIGANLGWVILAALGRSDDSTGDFLRRGRTLLLLATSVLIAAIGAMAFSLIAPTFHSFGEWALALELFPIVGSAALVFLISTPYRQIIRAERRQRAQLIIDLITCVALGTAAFAAPQSLFEWVNMASIIVMLQNSVIMLYVVCFTRPTQNRVNS